MAAEQLAEKLADFYETVRNEGFLIMGEDETKQEIYKELSESEILYFDTVVTAFIFCLDVESIKIVYTNAKEKCDTKNILLNAYFDLFLQYYINTENILGIDEESRQKVRDSYPSVREVRRVLKLLANNDRTKCGDCL